MDRTRGSCEIDQQAIEFPIVDGDLLIGRNRRKCEIVVTDPEASGVHAKLTYDGARWMVVDAGSRSGTRLGGERLATARPIEPGRNALQIGRHTLRFTALPPPPARSPGPARTKVPMRIRRLVLDPCGGKPIVHFHFKDTVLSRRIPPQQAHHLFILLRAGRDPARRGLPVSIERERVVVDPRREKDDETWPDRVRTSRGKLREWVDQLRDEEPMLARTLPDSDELLEKSDGVGVVAINLPFVDEIDVPEAWPGR